MGAPVNTTRLPALDRGRPDFWAYAGLLAGLVLFPVATPAHARVWYKRHQTRMGSQGQPLVQWTKISTVDGAQPFLTRVLYADRDGHRLVIRGTLNEDAGENVDTIQYVATGETLRFEAQDQATMVITAGTHQMDITRSEVEAYSPQGPTFPPDTRAEAAVLFNGLSEGFRLALGTLARTG